MYHMRCVYEIVIVECTHLTLDGVGAVSLYTLQASDVVSVIFPLIVLVSAKTLKPGIVLAS